MQLDFPSPKESFKNNSKYFSAENFKAKKAPIYCDESIDVKNRATIEAWGELYISAVEQKSTSTELLNLVDCEIPDLKFLWSDYLYKSRNSVILHAVSLLDKGLKVWESEEERQVMVKVKN